MAALLVVAFHVNHSFFGLPKYWVERPFGSFLEFGHSGVEFFFVLSGFIIYLAHRQDIGRSERFKAFCWKRFRRIYPVYWVVLAFVTPMFFLFPNMGTGLERDIRVVADSAALAHIFGGNVLLLSVSWTLFHETLFYGVFSLLILNKRFGSIILCTWMAASLAVMVSGAELPGQMDFYFSPLHLLFGFGMFAAWAIRSRTVFTPATLLVLGTVGFLGTGMEEVYGQHLALATLPLLYGVCSVAILAGAVELERSGRLQVNRSLIFLGNASYSIYLVHVIALSFVAKALLQVTQHGVPVSMVAIFAIMVAGGVAAGCLIHLYVEVPLLTLLGRRGAVRLPAASAGAWNGMVSGTTAQHS